MHKPEDSIKQIIHNVIQDTLRNDKNLHSALQKNLEGHNKEVYKALYPVIAREYFRIFLPIWVDAQTDCYISFYQSVINFLVFHKLNLTIHEPIACQVLIDLWKSKEKINESTRNTLIRIESKIDISDLWNLSS